jgi:hypothetical protein
LPEKDGKKLGDMNCSQQHSYDKFTHFGEKWQMFSWAVHSTDCFTPVGLNCL